MMTDITQKLPLELLVGILEHVSILDVLKFKQVNRAFHDAILASPLIQHKIDLFAAGFEYNATAGTNLADSRKAFFQYWSSLNTLCPIEERLPDGLQTDNGDFITTAGGVYAIIIRDSVRLLTLGPTSQGIPCKQWKIPVPVGNLVGYGFYPVADVIAFVDLSILWVEIHLRTLSEGRQYPAAQSPVIWYPRLDDIDPNYLATVLLTDFRLLLLVKTRSTWRFVIWDWKNAQILLEFDQHAYSAAEFVDDYRLLVCINPTSDAPPSIVLIDTEKFVGGFPVQTTYKLSHHFGEFKHPRLLMERGAHAPSPAESLAHFHRDPAQRIVALVGSSSLGHLVFRAKALLDFLEGREGSEVGWDEWKGCVVIPVIHPSSSGCINAWVSGCRLFCLDSMGPGPGSQMKMFDFSMWGRTGHVVGRVGEGFGVMRLLPSTGAVGQVSWDVGPLFYTHSSHDTVLFSPGDNSNLEGRQNLHIWVF